MDTMKKHEFIKYEHPKMVRPIYPDGKHICREDGPEIYDDYYHFKGGIASDEDINRWVDNALKFFEDNPDSPYWRTRMGTGGTNVIVLKWQEEDCHPWYEVIVSHHYREASIFPAEPFQRPTEEEIETFGESIDI
jgi:hypothetical protein